MSDPTPNQLDEVLAAYLEAVERGWAPDRQRLLSCYPELAEGLRNFFLTEDRVENVTAALRLTPSTSSPSLGTTVSDGSGGAARRPRVPGYQVLDELGRGGMGVVYRARQLACDRIVALKMILSGDQASPADRERFRTEVQAAARLQHPGIVQLFEVGEADGQPFFSMEYVAGGSLANHLEGTPLPPKDAARMVHQLADAVHAAHRAGIVHRDLKPANVLLASKGSAPPLTGSVPRIVDFGLAKMLDSEARTQSGAILGTPSYMAPEQARSQRGTVGPATDVYALGAILYELLTGRPPFKGATPLETALLVVSEELVPLRRLIPKCPRDLETICLKCLEKAPQRRYVTAEALAADLSRFLQGGAIQARSPGMGERAIRLARRNPLTAALVLLCGLSLVGLAVGGFWLAQEAEARARAEAESRRYAEAALDQESGRAQRYGGVLQDSVDIPELRERLKARLNPEDLSSLQLRGFEWSYLDRMAKESKPSLTFDADRTGIHGVAFSPDGKRLASASGDNSVKVWDAQTGKETLTLKGHTGRIESVTFSPDGQRLATGSKDHTFRVWDAATGKEIRELNGAALQAASPDGQFVASLQAGKDGAVEIRLRDVRSDKESDSIRIPWKAARSQLLLGWQGRSLAVFDPASAVVWNAQTGKTVSFTAPPGGMQAVALGKSHFAAVSGKQVQVCGLTTGDIAFTFEGHAGEVQCLAFDPDGRILATAGKGGAIRLWDTATGKLQGRLDTGGDVRSLNFSPDGLKLAAGNAAGKVQVWDASGDGHEKGAPALPPKKP